MGVLWLPALVQHIAEDFPVPSPPRCFPWAARRARTSGIILPLAPFFKATDVAPLSEWEWISTKEPRAHGSNLDNKQLSVGTVLFLPVHAPGALFAASDGHGVQGDGEVCINTSEMCLTGHPRLELEKGS